MALLVLLALVSGGATWNYERNVALEEAEARPYRTLSDTDLAALLAATEAEAAELGARYEAARDRRPSTRVDGAHTEERLRDFERVQVQGRHVRALGHRASELEASLDQLEKERDRRAARGSELEVFLRRAFGF